MTDQRVEMDVRVVNSLGMHARPAAEFVRVAATFMCEITVAKEGLEVNGKSIMGVLMLAAERGSMLSISAVGPDADAAAAALSDLVSHGFRELDAETP